MEVRRSLIVCAVLAVAMHAAAAWRWAAAPRAFPAAASPVIQVRFLAPPAEAPSLAAATSPVPATAPAAASPQRTTAGAQPAAIPEAAAQPQSVVETSAVAPSPAPQPLLPYDGRYWPRSELAVAPAALTPVVVAYPDDGPAVGSFVEVLALYIDETGTVRDVRFEGDELPPPLQRAAREAFAAAHFTPGQIDGHAVRARIRVEVTFESRRPLDERTASAVH